VSSLPKTVTRQRRDCDLNPDPSPLESSTLATRLPSHTLTHDDTEIWTTVSENGTINLAKYRSDLATLSLSD